MQLIDLRHLGRERVIGAWLVDDVLVDPGPERCIETLLDALGEQVPRAIALTHIHLDHAGATGSLVRRFPEVEVWVHQRGAPHLVDPTRLLASAGRLYGEDMQRLWGQTLAVPSDRLRVLEGGERIDGFQVAYTPGHANHHVSYLHEDSRVAFTGDCAGVRIEPGPVLAPTPPPDIDLERWRESLERIESWKPSALVATHFGSYADVHDHLQALRACLEQFERRAAQLTEAQFTTYLDARITECADEAIAAVYRQAMPSGQTYQGLVRYARRQR